MKNRTKQLTMMAMFAAIAYVLAAVGRLPITSTDFLKYDPKDVALAICGFSMGMPAALLVTLVASLIEALTVGTTGPIGFVMNVLSSFAFCGTAAWIYHKRRTLRGAVTGLIFGVLLMTAVMMLWNWLVTPYYMGVPRDAVVAMLLPVFLPFNLVKGGINAAVTMLLYKSVSRAMKQAGLMRPSEAPKTKSVLPAVIAAAVLIGCVIAVLFLRGIL